MHPYASKTIRNDAELWSPQYRQSAVIRDD